MLAIADPGVQPTGEVTRLRATRSGQQFAEMGEAAQRRIVGIGGIDRRSDDRQLLRPGRGEQHPQPVAQEGAVGGAVRQGQRVEPGGMPGGDPAVSAADPAHEDFGAAILVEQDRAGRKLLRLGGQEVHHHGLARARGADHREVAQITLVEVEEERRGAGGLQQGYRVTPVVAAGLAHGKAVKRAKTGHVGGGNHRPADKEAFVAGEHAPEARLKVHILAHRNCPGIGKGGGADRAGFVQRFQPVASDQDREVVIAKTDRTHAQGIARGLHLAPFGQGLFIGRTQAADREVDPLTRDLAVGRRVAFGQHQFAGQPQQVVGQARPGAVGIVLQAQQRAKAGATRPAQFQRVEPEVQPLVRQHAADVGIIGGAAHRPHLAIVERGQQLQHFRTGARAARVIAQQPRAVRGEGGQHGAGGGTQGAQFGGIGLHLVGLGAFQAAAQALGPARLAARRAAHQGDELVVDEQRAPAEPVTPQGVDMGGEGIVELCFQRQVDPPPDHVVIEHEPRIERAAEQDFAGGGVGVEFVRVGRLEAEAGDQQRDHQRAIAQLDNVFVDQPPIGEPLPRRGFLFRPECSPGPLAHHAVPFRPNSCCSPSAASCGPWGSVRPW